MINVCVFKESVLSLTEKTTTQQ